MARVVWGVSGPGRIDETVAQESSTKKARLAANEELPAEPVFFHTPCFAFFEDELTTTGASALVDMTPGAGYFLWAAVLRGVPSLGLCMSPAHHEHMFNHMMGMCLAEMAKEGSRIHDPRFVKMLGEHRESQAPPAASKPKPKASGAGGKGMG